MKHIYILILLFTALNCDSFLEPQNTDIYFPEDVDALDELLLGESYLGKKFHPTFTGVLPILEDDIVVRPYSSTMKTATGVTSYTPEYSTIMRSLAAYSWQPSFDQEMIDLGVLVSDLNLYSNFYELIAGTNIALDYVERVSGSQERKDLVRAQAYTLRAFYYFNLVNIYGAPYNYNKKALAIPLKLVGYVESRPMLSNTVEEVYNQIISDLVQAEELYISLPNNVQFSKDFRTNLPMVQLLLSRVYLYMEEWEMAAKYSDLVIKNNTFSLLNLSTIEENSLNKAFNYLSYDSPETIWLFTNSSDYLKFVGESLQATGVYRASPSFFTPSEGLLNSFEKEDLRRKRYFIQDTWTKDTIIYRPFGKIALNQGTTGTFDNSPSPNNWGRALRLSEAYLNNAESNAQLYSNGDFKAKNRAISAINELRKNRFKNNVEVVIDNPSELISFIREERRRELCFEAHRWFDLRRYGMPEIKHIWNVSPQQQVYTLVKNDLGYTLPLPSAVLLKNSNLVQNPLPARRSPVIIE